MHGILGIKKEQTQKFRVDGRRIPVTVVEVNNNPVIAIKTMEKDGYSAVQLGYGTAKKPSKPMQGHIKGAQLEKAPQFLREVRFPETTTADEMPKVGEFVSLEATLEPGDVIDVTGISKGKGFAGGVKRFHFKGGPRTHGQSDRERAPGSIGQTTTPGRVYKGKRMAGKMGFETVTVKNLTVAGIDGNILYIEGLIPGALGGLVAVEKKDKKDKKYADLIETAEKATAQALAEAQKAAETDEAKTTEQTVEESKEAAVEEVIAASTDAEPVTNKEEKSTEAEASAEVVTEEAPATTKETKEEEAK